ncbi:MAG: alpha/beta hydrolase [Treponemataceae bacterium]|nr:alpha/beta hydrolase [Treponemataceae bacterium]
MNKQKLFFDSTNGSDKICYFKYTPEGKPKAIFQIVHGMAEYAERYEGLAQVLCEQDYAVYIHEHVGHGSSAKDVDHLGLFLDDKQSITLVEDAHKMTEIAQKDLPGLKVNLFGHSMGSFVVRLTAAKYGKDYNSLIICGTGGANPAVGMGLKVLKLIKAFKGKDYKSKLIDKLSFGTYNDKWKPARTNMDWLSVNKTNVDNYIANPYCGYLFSVDGYKMLMEVNRDSNLPATFESTPKSLPVFLISGAMDPVGDYGAGVKSSYEGYQKAGVKDVSMKLYEGYRHEILLDDCAAEVRKDIVDFLAKNNK